MTLRIEKRFGWHAAVAAVVGVTAAMTFTGTATATSAGSPGIGLSVEASGHGKPSEREIRALFGQWNRALATLDPEQVADRYAPDAVLLPTVSNDVRTSRAEVVDYFEHFLKNKPQGTILESHVTVLGPRAAIDAGTYRFALTVNGVPTTVDARYTFVYAKIGGTWFIQNHHSSAMPEKA